MNNDAQSKTHKIAIIGSGPAGSTAALLLNQIGHDVHLFEREKQPIPLGAGIMLQPMALKVLDAVGVGQAIRSNGRQVCGIHGGLPSGKVVLDVDFRQCKDAFTGLGVHRTSLFSNLHDKLGQKNIRLTAGMEITEIHEDINARYRLETSEGLVFAGFDLVIIANGARSLLRNQFKYLIKHMAQQKHGAMWAKVDDPEDKYKDWINHTYHKTAEMLGTMPIGYETNEKIGNSKVNFFYGMPTSYLDDWRPELFDSWKERMLVKGGTYSDIIERIRSFEEIAVAPFQSVRIHPMHQDRVVFIGDAAHASGPHLSSGTNLALMDAYVLSEQISETPDLELAVKKYSNQRHRQIRYYHIMSRLITPLFQSNSNFSWWRNNMLQLLSQLPISSTIVYNTMAVIKSGVFSKIDSKYYK